MAAVRQQCGIFSLPDEILENVMTYTSYEDISNNRLVCKRFNIACQNQLNQGFSRVDKFHAKCQRDVRAQLPRRESERRNHPLARHVDILAAIETRLSLLHMTFMKYIDMGLCAFIPGKVLDEIFRVLRLVQTEPKPPRAHELLQELRDISSMAMEHFDEKIVPILKTMMPVQLSLNSSFPLPSSSGSSLTLTTNNAGLQNRIPGIRQDLVQLKLNFSSTHRNVIGVKKEVTEYKVQVTEIKRKLAEQEKRLADQDRVIVEQNRKLTEQDKLLSDMNRKLLDYDQKFDDVTAELTKVRSPPAGSNTGQMVQLQGTDGTGNAIIVEMQMKKGPESPENRECGRCTRSGDRAEVPVDSNKPTRKVTGQAGRKRQVSPPVCSIKGQSKRKRKN